MLDLNAVCIVPGLHRYREQSAPGSRKLFAYQTRAAAVGSVAAGAIAERAGVIQ
jgi:hypothetical protein